MPDARKKPRPNIWILATSNVDSWLHTPRTIVMLIAAVLLCMVETQKLFRLYTIDGYSLHLVESVFLLAYTGFDILMSSMMCLVTISELPCRSPSNTILSCALHAGNGLIAKFSIA